MPERDPPIHPGEILRDQYLDPLGISAYKLAKQMHVPVGRITAICNGSRAITADTAIRLGRAFGTTPQFWLNLQARYELDLVEDKREALEASIEPLDTSRAA